MKKTRCFLVKIKSITPRGDAYLIEDFEGNNDYFPKSTIFDKGFENELFIAEWILEKKTITFSRKQPYWCDPKTRKVKQEIIVEIIKTVPKKIEFDVNSVPDENLIK